MAGREPILRVIIGPYLSLKLCRIGSSWKNDLLSHMKLPMIGTVIGPGGSFLVFEDLIMDKVDLMRADTQSEKMIMNHVSIFFVCYLLRSNIMVYQYFFGENQILTSCNGS